MPSSSIHCQTSPSSDSASVEWEALLPYEIKRMYQERFRIFTHILIKYLEQKDSPLAGQVRDILKVKHHGTALLDRLKQTAGDPRSTSINSVGDET